MRQVRLGILISFENPKAACQQGKVEEERGEKNNRGEKQISLHILTSQTSSLELKNSKQSPTPTNLKTHQLKNLVHEVRRRLFIVALRFKDSKKKISTQMCKQEGIMLAMFSNPFSHVCLLRYPKNVR